MSDQAGTVEGTGVACPHCGEANASDASYCEHCGKALPAPGSQGPRIVTSDQTAQTASGRELQTEELAQKARRASGALLAVAILQTIGAALIAFLLRNSGSGPTAEEAQIPQEGMRNAMIIAQLVMAAAYWGLWFWSRSNPLPAALIGLGIYLAVITVSALANPSTLMQGIIIKVIIIGVLARAIKAGVDYRRIQREAAAAI